MGVAPAHYITSPIFSAILGWLTLSDSLNYVPYDTVITTQALDPVITVWFTYPNIRTDFAICSTMYTGQGAISTGASFWKEHLLPIMDKETDQEKSLEKYIVWVRTEYV